MTEKKVRGRRALEVVRPHILAATFRGTGDKLANLRAWNYAMAVIFLVQAVLIVALSKSVSLPVNFSYVTTDPLQSAAQGKTVLALATRHWFDVNVVYLLAIVFILAAIMHILAATQGRHRYEADLQAGRNELRWLEYTVTSSLMLAVLALLVGVQDAMLLLAVLALGAAFHLGALLAERRSTKRGLISRLAYATGAIAGLTPLVIIAAYIWNGLAYGTNVPGYLPWLCATMFTAFGLFAGNTLLQHRRTSRWADYVYGERIFMGLSLLAKTLLAWIVFAGALH